MKFVTLVSGGLDSTVMATLIQEEGIEQIPLFIDYGQLNLQRERAACMNNMSQLGLPEPRVVELAGYGASFPSGLTDRTRRIKEDAFLPGRNMLFLLCAAATASRESCDSLAIGFLDQRLSLFPDQRRAFVDEAESLLSMIMSTSLKVVTPLISMSKGDVLAIAKARGISNTYSCHAGGERPCGRCIACLEYTGLEV